ncbi:TetR/AcrR family transcriptional regulator [Nocardioides endophyticus]|uniref:TetR/AcrR family transcriptional regulator n=1 Tax=Nocardioides endophyticus TaxID=1353775 RepID=A0ABP8YZT6_9ACTN
MSDTHGDPRVERSRAQLTDALTTLLRTREPREISVSALCTEAGLSRPTFYQHFANLDEVAVAGIEGRFRHLRAELPEADGPETSYRLLLAWLIELDGERDAWQRTIGSGMAFSASRDAVEAWLVQQLAQHAPSATPPVLRYAAAGFLGAVRSWLLQDAGPDRPSAAELAASLVDVSARVLAPTVGTRSTLKT